LHYLYIITNSKNIKTYVGQTIKPKQRWWKHQSVARNPKKNGEIIHYAMAKHGIDNFHFEVIATCKSQNDANELEIWLINQYDSHIKNKNGYNVSLGGNNVSGANHPNYGKKGKSSPFKIKFTKELLSIINTLLLSGKNYQEISKIVNINRGLLSDGYRKAGGKTPSQKGKRKSTKSEFKKGMIGTTAGKKWTILTKQQIFEVEYLHFMEKYGSEKIRLLMNVSRRSIEKIIKNTKQIAIDSYINQHSI
jgi:group I intron endonuclease